ncbi:MAG: antitoxin family protein [Lacipirellulaceae bacterium]
MDSIPAIYEGGVFKPLGPVSLPEKARVRVMEEEPGAPADAPTPTVVDPEKAARQRAALQRVFDLIDNNPECQGPDDGWSVANNADELLYGGPNGPA